MVALASFILTVFLFSTSRNSRKPNYNRNDDAFSKEGRSQGNQGRKRYNRSGQKKSTGNSDSTARRSRQNSGRQSTGSKVKLELVPPPLTEMNGPRPTYFSCRHTYEETLIEELEREASKRLSNNQSDGGLTMASPSPGLVRVDDPFNILPKDLDPVYALQGIPDAVVVSSESIKGIAKAIHRSLLGDVEADDGDNSERSSTALMCEELLSAPRGSLAIHGLVPGMCKGQSNPVMLNRSQRVADELSSMLRKKFPAARKIGDDHQAPIESSNEERWLLQSLLMAPDIAVASLTKCTHVGPAQSFWPNWHHPVGLAKVDIEEKMPSSAYRKLMEALNCMRMRPEPFRSCAIDLGACPGGWTAALRRLDCFVISVDRSKLDPVLMNDDNVQFIKGDAFTFTPEVDREASEEVWMVSDLIAYPERVSELLTKWCGEHLAKYMIVTMKFQGEKPTLDDLDHALGIAEQYGYQCRAKHFFNNKNEVTLMLNERLTAEDNNDDLGPSSSSRLSRQLDAGVLGTAMYNAILPREK